MLLSMYYLKDCKLRLKSSGASCKGQVDLNQHKSKIYTILADMIMACEEAAFTLGSYDFCRYKQALINLRDNIRHSETPDDVRTYIEIYCENQFVDFDFDDYSIYDFSNSIKSHITRRVRIDELTLNYITHALPKPNRTVQLLDTRCGLGANLETIANAFENKITYGIEVDQNTAQQARERLDRIAVGGIYGSRITNDAFDIMLTEPFIGYNAIQKGNLSPYASKEEKKFMTDTIKYLAAGGVGIYVMPYYRMYRDIAFFISNNFENVQIRKTNTFDDNGLIVIMGNKKAVKGVDQSTYTELLRCHDASKIKDLMDEFEVYTLPKEMKTIETFRGSVLDPNELLHIVQHSGCMQNFWNEQRVELLSESSKQPLLPFNIGQIGLVLTSGCLDGVIDEGNGNYHLIKGKVSKQSSTESNYTSDTEIETQETISNRVEINVLLPNGEFKVLA